jgi:hypothetical protein
MPAITILSEVALPLLPKLLEYSRKIPAIADALSDASGYATRLGDLIVWRGSSGQKVLLGLQSLTESQARIQQAVTSIETAQLATNAALGSLHLLACANLGITALTGGFMLWRLEALNKRFDKLAIQIQDLDDKLDAQNKSHLRTAVQNLRDYDDKPDPATLREAKNRAQNAANIYGELTANETRRKEPRLDVLNYQGRCYLFSLVTELRARLLEESPDQVINRVDGELGRIHSLAKVTFKQAIGDSPAPFLEPETKAEGITLDLITEIYQQACHLKAFEDKPIRNHSEMFEYARSKGRSFSLFGGPDAKDLSKRLKYLIACFEDIGRVESLKLMAETIKSSSMNFAAIQADLRALQDRQKSTPSEAVFAYTFV